MKLPETEEQQRKKRTIEKKKEKSPPPLNSDQRTLDDNDKNIPSDNINFFATY